MRIRAPSLFLSFIYRSQNRICRKNRLLVVNDLSEVFLQSRAADQAAVDVGLCEQLGSGGSLYGAAVLDADLLSCICVIDLSDELADRVADFLGSRGRLPAPAQLSRPCLCRWPR